MPTNNTSLYPSISAIDTKPKDLGMGVHAERFGDKLILLTTRGTKTLERQRIFVNADVIATLLVFSEGLLNEKM